MLETVSIYHNFKMHIITAVSKTSNKSTMMNHYLTEIDEYLYLISETVLFKF